MAGGGPTQPEFEDPNGQFPGPSATGRWEWVEEDEEVINKNRRKKRKPPYEQRQQVDPQLQSPHMPTRRQVAGLGHRPPRPFQRAQPIPAQSQHGASLDGNAPSSSTNGLQHHSSLASGDESSTFGRGMEDDEPLLPIHANLVNGNSNTSSQTSRPLPRYHPTFPNTANMPSAASTRPGDASAGPSSTNTAMNAIAAGAPKTQSAQVLMSRIERMEKEQQDQKNLLSQILGAVQGITRE